MTPRTGLRRRYGRNGEHGQIIVLFALCLVAIVAMAGLLVDGGMAWANRRQAQAAADTAALAAAKAISSGLGNGVSAAQTIAGMNGFGPGVDCDGNPLPDGGVTVRIPPTTPGSAFAGVPGYVEVLTNRAMRTSFSQVVGQGCWMVSARAVASFISQAAPCTFCSLSNWQGDDRYVLLLNGGNDLRVDGGIFSNHATWYTGSDAVTRCGVAPGPGATCSAATCSSWNGLPSNQNVRMCGHNIYVQHNSGSTTSTLSAKTIATAGGWEAQRYTDIVHADELAADCPAHPQYMGYPVGLQETNVCIGATPIVDPLNDPANPAAIMPVPDYAALSTCGGPPYCGPVASATCVAEPGAPLKFPTAPNGLTILASMGGTWTICPGIYFGGFAVNGSGAGQPRVIMLPGTYVMIGGGFNVTGQASITSVSSKGDGITIYNSGGREAFSENFPFDETLIPSTCPPPVGSSCLATGTNVLNPPAGAVQGGVAVTYRLTVPRSGTNPIPTGTASEFTFYDGTTAIACESPGIVISTTGSALVAECTTRYNTFGDKGITAVYAGDLVYAPSGDSKTQVINPPAGTGFDNIELSTTAGPCAGPLPCGVIQLHAPTSDRYNGLLIFQDRGTGFIQGTQGIEIDPLYGATHPVTGQPLPCTGNWMTDGVPPDTNPLPEPCGSIGGLSGTIYAAHTATGVSGDWDAVVNLRASGAANVQIISAEIHFTQADNQARLMHVDSGLANGKIQLVE